VKPEIHPEYMECEVVCGCGEEFVTHATVPQMRVEVCSKCHPFYTGKQRFVDAAGRVEKFNKRWGKTIEQKKSALFGGGTEEDTAAEEPTSEEPASEEPASEETEETVSEETVSEEAGEEQSQ
jgi:large subunit ribosomal protein L31